MELKHPEWLQLAIDNQIMYGYDQEWYATSFQRTRGCGPTAAAMLLFYLNKRESSLLPYRNHSIRAIQESLENVWSYITPNWLLGLNSTKKFCSGMKQLLAHYRLNWQCNRLPVAACRFRRVSLSRVVEFVEHGLATDCPVAFLNLHKGQATALESWHWIVLISLAYDRERKQYIATCYDGGRLVAFDLGLWLETTKLGGGFVYITV